MDAPPPGQAGDKESSTEFTERTPALDRCRAPPVQTQTGTPQTWVNTDFYAQVSNVMPSGGVVLSPGQQLRTQESTPASEHGAQTKGKQRDESGDMDGQRQKEPQFHLLVVDPEGSGYTTESNCWQNSPPSNSPNPGAGYQTIPPPPVEIKPAASADANQLPYILPDSPQLVAPVADYTVVQELDTHHSLLLDPTPIQSPPPCPSQPPLKTQIPMEYITPDLLGNLLPWNDTALRPPLPLTMAQPDPCWMPKEPCSTLRERACSGVCFHLFSTLTGVCQSLLRGLEKQLTFPSALAFAKIATNQIWNSPFHLYRCMIVVNQKTDRWLCWLASLPKWVQSNDFGEVLTDTSA